MKKLYFLLFLILLSSFAFSQCGMTINGEAANTPASCNPNYQMVKNARDNVGGNLHYRQVWALHYRDEVADLDSGDAQPVFNYVTAGGCATADNRCYTLGTDNCSNYNTVNTTDHCKFVFLLEQIRGGIGEFAVIVGGQNGSNTMGADTIQTKMYNRFGNIDACSAFFSPVIGDVTGTYGCTQAGANRPCIPSAPLKDTPSPGYTTVNLTWAKPSDRAIVYTLDSEDALGAANLCSYDGTNYQWNPGSRQAALDAIITGWEIYYLGSASSNQPAGDRSLGWTAVDDTDATSVLVGTRRYSTDTNATVVVPNSAGTYIFFAVSPVFDGLAGTPGLRGTIGNKSVNLQNVLSGSSFPIFPTPVTIVSFTAVYTDLQHVKLDWETASETDAMGFFLYRSVDGQSWTKVNQQLIPAKGQGGAGATYTYTDTVPKQRTYTKYYYKVEEITNNGQRGANAQTETTR